MKTTISLLLLCAVFSNCSAADAPAQPKKARLTAEQAKDALLRFIRVNRTTFIGDPDPDKLAGVPVRSLGEGRYSLGAFQLDLTNLSYSAAIGVEGPAPYFYSGAFTQHDGAWTATPPNIQHAVRRLPDKPK